MEIRHLQFFKRAAELEHLTKAANELYISQSHLSHIIAEMEKELGVPLFDRVGRGIVLNACGREFYRDTVELFNKFEDSKKKSVEIYRRQQTQLTLITNVSTYMPALMHYIRQERPDISIRQLSGKRKTIARRLLESSVDVAICCPTLSEIPEIESKLIHRERGVIIYPEGHWLEGRELVDMEELRHEKFISVDVGYGTRDSQDLYLQSRQISVENAIESSDTSTVFDYVNYGLGIAIAPITMTKKRPDFQKRYVELTDSPQATIGLSIRKGQYSGEAVKEGLRLIEEYYSSLKPYMPVAPSENLISV